MCGQQLMPWWVELAPLWVVVLATLVGLGIGAVLNRR